LNAQIANPRFIHRRRLAQGVELAVGYWLLADSWPPPVFDSRLGFDQQRPIANTRLSRSYGRILNSQLIHIRLILGRVVAEFVQLRPEALHLLAIQVNGRGGSLRYERLPLRRLSLLRKIRAGFD